MKTTLNAIREHGPCKSRWAKLLAHLGKTQADDEPLPILTILEFNGLDDALWALRAVRGHDREIRLYAVWCARQVQHLMKDKRSLDALDMAEKFANGTAYEGELTSAWAAADAAAYAAATYAAAEAAAWAAAWAAADDASWTAADDASWTAADAAAAYAAAEAAAWAAAEANAEAAAWAAAEAASWAAAWAAAEANARPSSRAAAEAASRAASRAAQKQKLIEVCGGLA